MNLNDIQDMWKLPKVTVMLEPGFTQADLHRLINFTQSVIEVMNEEESV